MLSDLPSVWRVDHTEADGHDAHRAVPHRGATATEADRDRRDDAAAGAGHAPSVCLRMRRLPEDDGAIGEKVLEVIVRAAKLLVMPGRLAPDDARKGIRVGVRDRNLTDTTRSVTDADSRPDGLYDEG